jgi:bifunctional non-homologous end joining protein LigD
VNAIELDGHTVDLSHPHKSLYPQDGITKGDVMNYYRRVAPRMLPYLRDRPLVMRRFPDGVDKEGFFQKERAKHFPDWIRTTTLDKVEGGTVTHVVCNDAATLVFLANQGTIEFHTLLAPTATPHRPDRLIFDLDPSTDDLTPVMKGTQAFRDLLVELDVTGFVCSTGSRGVHVHVLLDRSGDFDAARGFARRLAETIAAGDPDSFTVEQRKAARGSRLFIDTLRNGFGQHAIAPYSLRARARAPVAVPVTWDEATKASFHPRGVALRGVFRRLGAQQNDPWAGMSRHRYSIRALSERLDRHARHRDPGRPT